jgi:hypothetical protein
MEETRWWGLCNVSLWVECLQEGSVVCSTLERKKKKKSFSAKENVQLSIVGEPVML